MKLRGWFHDWRVTKIQAYVLHNKKGEPAEYITEIHLVCQKCRRAKNKTLEGDWDSKEILLLVQPPDGQELRVVDAR